MDISRTAWINPWIGNEAVFLILEHSSPKGIKQKKHKKKHEIVAFKFLLQEIQLKNLSQRFPEDLTSKPWNKKSWSSQKSLTDPSKG